MGTLYHKKQLVCREVLAFLTKYLLASYVDYLSCYSWDCTFIILKKKEVPFTGEAAEKGTLFESIEDFHRYTDNK